MRSVLALLPCCVGCSVLLDLGTLAGTDAGATDGRAPLDSGEAGSVDGAGGPTFFDDFNRPDSIPIGNGWIMKQPPAFRLASQRVENRAVSTGYRDDVVYRPPTEDLLNVAVSIEFRLTAAPGYPQVHARVQQATVAVSNTLDSYIFFIANAPSSAVLGRQRGSAYLTNLATIPLSPPVDTAHDFRLRLTVTGTAPVMVQGDVEMFDAQMKKWITIGSQPVMDMSVERIDTPGSVGFSQSDGEALYYYDNFTRTAL